MVGSTVWWGPQCGGVHSVVGSTVWWGPQCGVLHGVVEVGSTVWWGSQWGGVHSRKTLFEFQTVFIFQSQ